MAIRKRLIALCFVIAAFGVAFALFVIFQVQKRYTANEPNLITQLRVAVKPRSLFPERDILYVLVFGTDSAQGLNHASSIVRADTLLLARVDLKNQKLRLVNIPSNTRVKVPGKDRYDQIDRAFASGGPRLSVAEAQNLLGVPIDYYVRVKEEELNHLVDAVGGIDINVEKKINGIDPASHLRVEFQKGYQHLNGDKAAQYFRVRMDEAGVNGQLEREQKVIKGIRRRLTDSSILANLSNIVDVAKKSVETNLQVPQLFALANLFKGVQMSNVEAVTFSENIVKMGFLKKNK